MKTIHARGGFSLMELMIAMSLGLIILLTTYSGFRVASQSITSAERKALENKLIVAGMMIMLDEVDFWYDLDVPSDAEQQWLRTTPSKSLNPTSNSYAAEGTDWQQLPQPFTGFSASWERSEAVHTFDPDSWQPHNEESWYRGDGSLFFRANGSTVYYNDQSSWGNYGTAQAAGQRVDYDGTNPVVPNTRWLPDQHKGLMYGLGFYGWFDYMPAHAMVDFYDVASNGRALKPYEIRVLQEMTENDWGGPDSGILTDEATYIWEVQNSDWHGRIARQTYRATGLSNPVSCVNRSGAERAVSRGSYLRDTHMGISAPITTSTRTDPITGVSGIDGWRASINRMIIGAYGHGGETMSSVTALMQSLNRERSLIDLSDLPTAWPDVRLGLRRTMHMGNITNYGWIRLVDPVTGVSEEVFMPVIGTTLRGARINRGLD